MLKKFVTMAFVFALGSAQLAHAGSVTTFGNLGDFQTAVGSSPVTLETFYGCLSVSDFYGGA